MKTAVGDRGLVDYTNFIDTYGSRVWVRTSSSAMGDRVWLSVGRGNEAMDFLDPNGRRLYWDPYSATVTKEALHGTVALKAHASAHLNYEQALAVRDALTEWLQEHEPDTRKTEEKP